MSNKNKGLYEKFQVVRTDGESAPGHRHADCRYFILDLTHDPYALPAVRAYAKACAADYPVLAEDLLAWVRSQVG